MSTDDLEVARVFLDRLGIDPRALLKPSATHGPMPTFAGYVPQVSAVVSAGTRRTYRPYWSQLTTHWPDRRIDEPTALELQALVQKTRTNAVVRRNGRGGRSAAEHMVAAIRCLYKFAEKDHLISRAQNPSNDLDKPRRLPSSRRALSHRQLTEINHAAATTGNDPDLDTLILRLHLETVCRTSSALALRHDDLDPDEHKTRGDSHCQIRLSGKGGTLHWQPVSPTLMTRLSQHRDLSPEPNGQLLRYRNGHPITRRRYDHLWNRIGRELPWVTTRQITTHWLRHTTITWIERNFGYATARAFAAHAEPTGQDGTTLTYVTATDEEVAFALSALTGEPHPIISSHDDALLTPPTSSHRAASPFLEEASTDLKGGSTR
ncbi:MULTISPECIES: tyrosine-type recombinase/integrase [Nocardia]|uniref:tyrosine-type recombinase/integrase n=1 Tax=Nocardia TaxID=1817 RepID=UPI001E33DAF2|nr:MULTISPECIES: site-specific integrase [Nocardia]